MPTKEFFQHFNSLDDFKVHLERIDRKNLAFDINEKSVTQFIINKVKLGGLNNTPETADAIFLLLQKLAKKNKISYSFKKGLHFLDQIKAEMNQKNYAELLENFLNANAIAPSISFLQKKTTAHKRQTLLPETEYDPPQEPGHWREPAVGINRTYSFNPSQEATSIFERFSTKYLKELFMWSFPWAIDIPLADVEKTSKKIKKRMKNLLAIDTEFSAELQFKTIQCLLLCLDGLGKACGNNGELSLRNYDEIKYIATISQALETDLKNLLHKKLPLEQFTKNLSRYTSKLKEKDQELYDAHFHNPLMNHFCHTNEAFSAKSLNLHHQKSVLKP